MGVTSIPKFSKSHVPAIGNDIDILFFIKNEEVDLQYLNYLKEITSFSDEVIAHWLDVSVKTLRNYRKSESDLKESLKEHLVLLLSLYQHGTDVFGNAENFDKWLDTKNYFFDNQAPKDYLSTSSGIRFTDDRLTAMEYGDNV
ncbi:MbcA/ParS/Xre antitoxin family protein [Aquiflexum sp. LQ15W]|uniref:antitoxin Xre/MbcA/ParS toxin-binding domain-containing protein n=1 Tax=Cognataquiflexum nitidum TaxID=2922272 RepID=UPI001F1350DC|nr:MbcA/ParS/Xre antitoxin family protein [Cognataquiflexum nitidum]MCH6199951.1 MbcA/ParS/Xre antitoxin family protein [Cognataquiflexum nitidum]